MNKPRKIRCTKISLPPAIRNMVRGKKVLAPLSKRHLISLPGPFRPSFRQWLDSFLFELGDR
jgi:hypothetical protein